MIESVQQALKGTAAEGRVSRADLVALAGARAVAITGGPAIDICIGRDPPPPLPPAKHADRSSALSAGLLRIDCFTVSLLASHQGVPDRCAPSQGWFCCLELGYFTQNILVTMKGARPI